MNFIKYASAAALLSSLSFAAPLSPSTPPLAKADIKEELKQSINIGFVNTNGNTKTTNLNGKYELDYTTKGFNDKKLELELDISAFVSENNDIRDNEEFRVRANKNQFITDKLFLYGTLNWMKNEFLNFESNWDLGLGVGKEMFKNETHNLQLKIGLAHNVENYTIAVDGSDENVFTSLTQYIEYNRNLNPNSKFYTKLGISENLKDCTDDYNLLANIGLNFKVAENISVILEEEIRYDSIPASEHKTDTKTLAKIGYSF